MGEKFGPSDEQINIINEIGNVVVTAKPGSGKTYTIVEKIKVITEQLKDYQGVIAISFTRKASHELEVRCKKKNIPLKQSFYGTIDHFYISQIIMPFTKHITHQINHLDIHTNLRDFPEFSDLIHIVEGITPTIEELLIRSLSEGHIFLEICGETAFFILTHVKEAKEYLLSRYTHIFIDEYQDCGEIQHKIFLTLVEGGMIGFAVGDLDQAIYAFSNRFSKFLASLIKNTNFKHFEITKNHRCHESISNYSLKMMGIDVVKSDNDLRVIEVKIQGGEEEIMTLVDKYLPKIKEKYCIKYNNQVAILCRNNSTAQRAHKFLKTSSKLFVETELDRYNAYWARLFNNFLQCYYDKNLFQVDFVEKYINEEISPKIYKKAIRLIDSLFKSEDFKLINHISEIIDFARMVYPEYENQQVITAFSDILTDREKLLSYKPASEEEICILTLHKSKGLEFKIVFHLDLYKWIFPFEGISEEDYIQSLNLHYVGVTRAIEVCYLIQGSLRYRTQQQDLWNAVQSPFLQIEGLSDLRRKLTWI